MEWSQIAVIVGINIALLGAFITVAIWGANKIDNDVKSICNRLDGHATRIDQLYKMFCQSQKENHDKFYDLLREKK